MKLLINLKEINDFNMILRLNEMGSDAVDLIETNLEVISLIKQPMTNQMAFVLGKIISMCKKLTDLRLSQTQSNHLEIMLSMIGNKVIILIYLLDIKIKYKLLYKH